MVMSYVLISELVPAHYFIVSVNINVVLSQKSFVLGDFRSRLF